MTIECNDPEHANLKAFQDPADRLGDMFAVQADLQRLLGKDWTRMDPDTLAAYRTEMAWSICDEVHEAMQEVGYKSWATSRHVNRDEFMDEMTDAWLFWLNLAITVGMTADDLFTRYRKKRANAEERHRAKYDGRTTKCQVCKRALDNEAVKCTPDQCHYEVPFDQAIQCRLCGHDYIDTRCAPVTTQALGWCDTQHKTFMTDGTIVDA